MIWKIHDTNIIVCFYTYFFSFPCSSDRSLRSLSCNLQWRKSRSIEIRYSAVAIFTRVPWVFDCRREMFQFPHVINHSSNVEPSTGYYMIYYENIIIIPIGAGVNINIHVRNRYSLFLCDSDLCSWIVVEFFFHGSDFYCDWKWNDIKSQSYSNPRYRVSFIYLFFLITDLYGEKTIFIIIL